MVQEPKALAQRKGLMDLVRLRPGALVELEHRVFEEGELVHALGLLPHRFLAVGSAREPLGLGVEGVHALVTEAVGQLEADRDDLVG